MATYLRPRRGKKATAERILVGDAKLKKGEVFFEANDNGVGKGPGKIKLGDGITDYEDLPYFIDPENTSSSIVEFTEASDADGVTKCDYDLKNKSSITTLMSKISGAIRNFHNRITGLESNSKFKIGRTIKAYTEINAKDQYYYLEGALYIPRGYHTIQLSMRTNFGYVSDRRLLVGFIDTKTQSWHDIGSLFPPAPNYWKNYTLFGTYNFAEDTYIYPAVKTVNSVDPIKDAIDPNTGRGLGGSHSLDGYYPIYKLTKSGTYICGGFPIYDANDGTDHYLRKNDGLYYKCDKDGNINSGASGSQSLPSNSYTMSRIKQITTDSSAIRLYSGDCRLQFKLSATKENTYFQQYDLSSISDEENSKDFWGEYYVEDYNGGNIQMSLPLKDE